MEYNIKGNYEGYLWMSNESQPKLYRDDSSAEIKLIDGENPFVIEGNLFDKKSGESISIKFVDGHYIVTRFHVDAQDLKGSDRATVKEYIAQRITGVAKVRYLQYWDIVKDILCDGMETLRPWNMVFIGFNDKEE